MKKPLDEEKIVRQYVEKGMTIQEITFFHTTSFNRVREILQRNNVAIRDWKLAARKAWG